MRIQPTVNIHLPVMQRFDCQSCGFCCRNLVVNVSADERKRIEEAGWSERIPDHPLFVSYRFHGRRLQRLAHRSDGRCVFLSDDQRCRLHAESGVGTKPLPCRLYPFVPTPGADGVRIDMRGDCPSVAANEGRILSVHAKAIAGLAAETGAIPMRTGPDWPGVRPLSTGEFAALADVFGSILVSKGSNRTRLRRGCTLLDLLYGLRVRRIRDERFLELLAVLREAVSDDPAEGPGAQAGPRTHKLFRQWLFLHGIADDPEQLRCGPIVRMQRSWQRYLQSREFVRSEGAVPALGSDWAHTTFAAIRSVAPAPDDALEPLVRSMRVKLDAHAFAGPRYFGADVLSGLTALWLLPGLVGWFARLSAVGAGRDVLSADDVLAGVRRAHHTFGVSPVFRRISERLRLRALSRPGVAQAVLAGYGP